MSAAPHRSETALLIVVAKLAAIGRVLWGISSAAILGGIGLGLRQLGARSRTIAAK